LRGRLPAAAADHARLTLLAEVAVATRLAGADGGVWVSALLSGGKARTNKVANRDESPLFFIDEKNVDIMPFPNVLIGHFLYIYIKRPGYP